ncbi:2-C-methyl-D-erythritol 4-phosphate cytidylyltransferase [Marinomonas sp. 15G1-11]|uniref:2-C-methyl-D-erythritol 4-phosphate cytidylyltransferase n=1 Tax=Marinomonas phaeophyticola TaxID=3004091 RepID=A0ABT4JVC0_9GAMM|nr:2-C-methyl-D-erythritol 4-phosphate cytidylyltransferase [Marinomonas sp. 15G1-11]MCZ2721728.1 2-C-methyl-D-erythritol 4-phosphate cytidylyltransferase [Marinomonas sp. 15G1-11]
MSACIWVVVPAAGVGKRMQSNTPKQYLPLGANTVLDCTLGQLLSHNKIAGVLLGLGSEDSYWPDSIWFGHEKIKTFVGGVERADTVRLGLDYLSNQLGLKNDFVLVHDAARPLIAHQSIDDLLANTNPCGGILAIPAKDTIKQSLETSKPSCVEKTIDRNLIWQAQTPQKFMIKTLIDAIDYAKSQGVEVTDESSAMELSGYQPALIEGDTRNFKITLPIDLVIANALLMHEPLQ